jgi:hypothetical protein
MVRRMRWSDCPELFVEALAAHQLFLRMGYAPDSVAMCMVETTGEVGVVLREPEGELSVQVGYFEGTAGALLMAWHFVVDAANGADDASVQELEQLLQDSTVFSQAADIIVALRNAGIPFRHPAMQALNPN